MPQSTPTYAIPYVLPGDPRADFPVTHQAQSERIEALHAGAVIWDAPQTLTAPEQSQAVTNIGTQFNSIGTADQRAALNTWLADGNPLSVKQMVGAFNLSVVLTVPDGVTLDLTRAQITQTGANKITLALGNGSTLLGGHIIGLGTDYVAGAGTTTVGVDVNGKTGVKITGLRVSNVSGSSIRIYASTDVQISSVTLVGVGSPTIASGDGAPCFGVNIDNASTRVAIDVADISECCQGIIGGLTSNHISLSNVKVHDIRGQHGVYLQNGTGLNVAELDLWNIPLNGMKVQLSGSSTSDSQGTSIIGVTANNCADNALNLANIATDLTAAMKFRGVTVSGLAAVNCGRGLYLGSVRGATVSDISVYNCVLDGITLLDCGDIEGNSWVIDTAGRIGVRFTLATGSVQNQIAVSGLRIHNPAGSNVASNIWGVYMLQGSNVTLDGLRVTATNGFMQYGLFLASASETDQTSFSLLHSELSGDTGVSARFRTPVAAVKDWYQNRLSGTILNLPTNVVFDLAGLGSPEGVTPAPVGSMFHRTDGGPSTSLYIKESGGVTNTGWVASATGATNPTDRGTTAVGPDATGGQIVVPVTFASAFATVPIVTATGDDSYLQVGVRNATTTGFELLVSYVGLNYQDTAIPASNVNWTAVE